jgi:hypothetical protein
MKMNDPAGQRNSFPSREDEVLAFEDVERLRDPVVDVKGRPKIGRFICF